MEEEGKRCTAHFKKSSNSDSVVKWNDVAKKVERSGEWMI
jgi:hypothetical protein